MSQKFLLPSPEGDSFTQRFDLKPWVATKVTPSPITMRAGSSRKTSNYKAELDQPGALASSPQFFSEIAHQMLSLNFLRVHNPGVDDLHSASPQGRDLGDVNPAWVICLCLTQHHLQSHDRGVHEAQVSPYFHVHPVPSSCHPGLSLNF